MAILVATVETAIESIMSGGQSATVDGISYTAASLPALTALRDQLRADAAQSKATRPTFRAFNFGSMGYD